MKKVVLLVTMTLFFIGCEKKEANHQEKEKKSKEISEVEKLAEQSQKTLGIANAFMGAMGSGDMEKMKSLMHEDMVWQNAGDANLPWIGPWKGKKAILEEFLPSFGQNFVTKKWEPSDGFAHGDTAAYFGQMIGLLTKSNKETSEFTYALRVKVKDGKVILWNWFEDSYEVSRAYHSK